MGGNRTLRAIIIDFGWKLHLSQGARKKIAAIGLLAWLRYKHSRPGTVVRIRVGKTKLKVRSGTHDLEVALTSLNGEFDSLIGLLPEEFAGTVIDAGGYIGTATLALRQVFPRARIICIEPSSKNLEILRWNLRNETNVEVLQGAIIGNRRDFVELSDTGTGEWGYSVSLGPSSTTMKVKSLETVKGFTLSDLGVGRDNVGVIKLDIEGGEMELLSLDDKHLSQIPVVLAELHDEIIPGCTEMFFRFSSQRQLVQPPGEKWLSLSY